MPNTTPVGLVLAGGAGRRMGRDKASLPVGGRTLALAAAERLAELCGTVCISIAAGAPNPAPGFPVIEDATGLPRGPLAGIAAAYREWRERDLLVLACDYPCVRIELLRCILFASESERPLTMAAGERDHPLVALWHRSLRGSVEEALASNRLRVRDLVARLSVSRVTAAESGLPDHERQLINVNRPEDLLRLDSRSSE